MGLGHQTADFFYTECQLTSLLSEKWNKVKMCKGILT